MVSEIYKLTPDQAMEEKTFNTPSSQLQSISHCFQRFCSSDFNQENQNRHFSKRLVGGGDRLFLITTVTIVNHSKCTQVPAKLSVQIRVRPCSLCKYPTGRLVPCVQRVAFQHKGSQYRHSRALCTSQSFQPRVSFCPLLCRYTWTWAKKTNQISGVRGQIPSEHFSKRPQDVAVIQLQLQNLLVVYIVVPIYCLSLWKQGL